MTSNELRSAIEAVLFAASEPVAIDDLVALFSEEGKEAVVEQLDEIRKFFGENVHGFHVEAAAGGYRFATRPENDPFLRRFFSKQKEGRLSVAALETLAIVAYRQPITAPEISDLRGVNSSGVIRTLLERRMIRIAGRKNVVGSPFLYRTTRDFLTHFGLSSIQELPRLEEFADILGENIGEELLGADIEGAFTAEPQGAADDVETSVDAAQTSDGAAATPAEERSDAADEAERAREREERDTSSESSSDDVHDVHDVHDVEGETRDDETPQESVAHEADAIESDVQEIASREDEGADRG